MTGPKGNSKISFPETLIVRRGKVFCYTSQLKIEQIIYLTCVNL